MKKEIRTESAPLPIGPYSQGIASDAGELVFTAGQIALEPGRSELCSDNVENQARQAMENVRAILDEAGSGIDQVIKVTIFLRDMNDYARVNQVYSDFFSEPPYPARSVVEVARLPMDALVEIEAVARRGKS